MKTFKDFVLTDTHDHGTFEKIYSCFVAYVGRQRGRGDSSAIQYRLDAAQCREEYHDVLIQGNISYSHVSASTVLQTFVRHQVAKTTQGLRGKSDDSKRRLTTTSSESSVPSKRSAAEVVSEIGEEAEEADVSAPSPEPPHKKVTFLEVEFPSECGSDYADSNPSSTRSSLNSIDFRFIDHLVGPGTSSSRLTTNARLIIDQLDVSQLLMDARRSMIKKQSEITDVSDLLTINFIFDANFLKKHVPTNILTSFLSTPLPTPPDREMKLLLDCSVFAASHSFQETKRHIRNKIQTEGESLVTDILRHYTERPYLWQHSTSYPIPPPSLTQNEDTYTQAIVKNIILGVVGDLELSDHWSRDPLPTPAGFEEAYNPDYFAEYDEFPLLIVEIKKPGANDNDLEGDQRKLPCMQKLMIDHMLGAGIKGPIVVGFLIRRSRCEISLMSLDHEALYVVKSIGAFELPRNNLQLSLLCPGLGLLKLVHEVVSKTLAAIKARDSNRGMKGKWRRPSYYVKGNRIPIPKVVVDEYVDPTALKAADKDKDEERPRSCLTKLT